MSSALNRRQFLARSAALATIASGVHVGHAHAVPSTSANEKLNLAIIGTGNKGWHNVQQLTSQNIVAICDVDTNFLGKAATSFPQAKQFRDYRKLLDASQQFDAVVVSTADHTHAPATSIALSLGKHAYCEKPLTHSVEEARTIAQLAARHKVATQMGTQVHGSENYRRVVEVIRSGAIGPVGEVYNWCNKGWSDGRFAAWDKPVPANLDWDLWLGPAHERPYAPNIHPGNWRRFWEYGSGTLGDMACHVMDLPFWALDLRYPTAVAAEGPPVHPDGTPAWIKARYDFPARDKLPPVKFYWSDGGVHEDIVKQTVDRAGKSLSKWGLGVLFVGSEGMLAANYGGYELYPQEKFAGFQAPSPTIPRSVGHWNEWIEACKNGTPTTCNFDYSGALTETVLLGAVAFRTGQRLEWDAAALRATNCPEAERYVRKQYRRGFELIRSDA